MTTELFNKILSERLLRSKMLKLPSSSYDQIFTDVSYKRRKLYQVLLFIYLEGYTLSESHVLIRVVLKAWVGARRFSDLSFLSLGLTAPSKPPNKNESCKPCVLSSSKLTQND